jgi:hypothetical protein
LESLTDHYEDSEKNNAVSFRSDNMGHLVLRSAGEHIALDFGTGLLQRTTQFGPAAWRTDVELYTCTADGMKQAK